MREQVPPRESDGQYGLGHLFSCSLDGALRDSGAAVRPVRGGLCSSAGLGAFRELLFALHAGDIAGGGDYRIREKELPGLTFLAVHRSIKRSRRCGHSSARRLGNKSFNTVENCVGRLFYFCGQ